MTDQDHTRAQPLLIGGKEPAPERRRAQHRQEISGNPRGIDLLRSAVAGKVVGAEVHCRRAEIPGGIAALHSARGRAGGAETGRILATSCHSYWAAWSRRVMMADIRSQLSVSAASCLRPERVSE